MFAQFLQYLFSGLTAGAIYALAGLGFAIVYNASRVINFAQGEFIMIGGMATAALVASGVGLMPAAALAAAAAMAAGVALERLAVGPARTADPTAVVIVTIGASIFLRGVAQVVWGKEFHAVPAFSGDVPLVLAGASLMPQSLWVAAVAAAAIAGLWWFFHRTLFGKAMLATASNPLAARLVGIPGRLVLSAAFALSALLGAVGGIVMAPLTFTHYEAGIMLGLKGFAAAVLGGLGSGGGAVLGGLLVGVAEALAAGYLSSAYKDAVAFAVILLVLFVLPGGLVGTRSADRV